VSAFSDSQSIGRLDHGGPRQEKGWSPVTQFLLTALCLPAFELRVIG